MPLLDDMEEESAIPRRVKQDPETVSPPPPGRPKTQHFEHITVD